MNRDLFSGHASIYASFRPVYPEHLYQFILGMVPRHELAWDCGTGNGQVASRLAQSFSTVYATDISSKQIAEAAPAPNIRYSVQPAEATDLLPDSFDLITVGQALHWFDRERFFSEAKRVARRGCILAAFGYGNIRINDRIDPLVADYYSNIVGPYWDVARLHVENGYRDVTFPFDSIPAPEFFIEQDWSLRHLIGYLESWSATQAYIRDRNANPLTSLAAELADAWGEEETLPVHFPVFVKAGVIEK